MFRNILLILIFFIALGCLQLIVIGQSMHNNIPCHKITREIKQNHEKKKPFFSWAVNKIIDFTSWNYYKRTFISDDGRVIDHQRASVTTSEGQAYAMRRAIMMNDKKTFDKTYNWAKYNLQHKNDKLFAWLWGQKKPGPQMQIEWGILDQNGATDAGVEIAVNLIFAYKIWNQENYIEDAMLILNDIWDKETIEIQGERILVAGINQNKLENIEVNPSYFMPYSFRILSVVDKKHDWKKLVDSSYRLTNWCLDNIKSGLPPDVFYINRNTGAITFDNDKSKFCYDAVRAFYIFYVDYTLTKDSRAEKLLSKSKIFIDRWKCEKKFYTCYKQNGELENYDEAIGSIAVILPAIKMYDNKVADEIYQNRIKAKYHSEGYWGDDPMDYYAQNLVWFGNWLYQDEENINAFKY